jgi:hypothetical protein
MDPHYGDDFMGKSRGMHGESMGNAFRTTISWGNHGEFVICNLFSVFRT